MALSSIGGRITRLSATYHPSYSSTLLCLNRINPRLTSVVSTQNHHHNQSSKRIMATSSASPEVAANQERTTAPYGSWRSPITADVVAGASKSLEGTAVDPHGRLIWLESRPNEAGRAVLVREAEKPGDEAVDITPKDFAVRTVAQEYGGGAFTVSGDTVVLFPNHSPQIMVDQYDHIYLLLCVDRRQSSTNATTEIVAVTLGGDNIQEPEVLVRGNDFYAFPRIDAKGERIAWIEWSHPNMPWDKTELWVGYISDNGEIYKRICIAGFDPAVVESPTEPKWSSSGNL
ncbi:hypothetical protein TIFTF001_040612 [Ficus carica]|uniref:Uncharacterized protein n=1 Tax=Ficus carica TaxID=3494 RepID=A0AA87YWN6_FICCA|nr:hypothetical protein TIFTF001_040608 [Ficus carica]GMN24753.1 hypothetical protein TIFTF001_040612 [Ficus carica]